jgi:hypothetical protein
MLHVKHVFGRDDKDQIARAFAAEEVLRKGTSAPSRWRPPFQRYKTDMVIRSRFPTIYQYRLDLELQARMQTNRGRPHSH